MVWDEFDPKKQQQGGGDFKPPEIKIPKMNLPNFNFPGYLLILVPVLLWFVTGGYFIVQPDEEGVVIRFGEVNRKTQPGFHIKFPPPIEKVYLPKITEVKREEIGFRIESTGPPARYRDIPAESLMLTGDENIVDIDVVVQYRIVDSINYLFKVVKPRLTLHAAAESAIREIIGSHTIDEALTEGKYEIQGEIKKLLQEILSKYETGLEVSAVQLQDVHPPKQVIGAFKDVASAREDKNRYINEAEGYRNALIPQARGEAAKIIKEAQGYKLEKIDRSKGDSLRFLSLMREYEKAEEVTKQRLYIETVEEVLPGFEKYIIENPGGVLPLLSLGKNAVPNILKGSEK
ncbi:MAG: FtsH protease activity modulator HflK [Nitrospinota bacterium]